MARFYWHPTIQRSDRREWELREKTGKIFPYYDPRATLRQTRSGFIWRLSGAKDWHPIAEGATIWQAKQFVMTVYCLSIPMTPPTS